MKKIIMGIFILSTVALMCAAARPAGTPISGTNVPYKVRSAFHHEYKDASAITWVMKNGKWDVSFRKEGATEMSACYNWSGHRIDSRMMVPQSDVPARIIEQLKDKYPEGFAHEFTKIQRPWKRDLYLAKVKQNGMSKSLYLDKNGPEHDYAIR